MRVTHGRGRVTAATVVLLAVTIGCRSPSTVVGVAAVRTVRRTAVDLGLAVALLALTVLVHVGAWPIRVDRAVYRVLLPLRTGTVADAAQVVVALARPEAVGGITIAVALGLAARERSSGALRVLVPPVLAVAVVVLGGKALLHRLGPPGTPALGTFGYYPSGHTATTLVCAGALAQLLALRRPSTAATGWVLVATWTVLVASSMVVRGYHWSTDVVAAALAGTLVLRLLARLH